MITIFFSKFTASVQVESYEPFALLNYSTNLNGTNLGTYSLMYNSQKINATVGHFYEQFGSGMILRNWRIDNSELIILCLAVK